MAVIHKSISTNNIKNCSFAVVGNTPTGQGTTNYSLLETVCHDSAANTTSVINTFNTRLDSRFQSQFVVLDGGTA